MSFQIMKAFLCSIGLLCAVSAGSISREENGRAFPIFSIVKFKNDDCDAGNDRRGTCYTREECDSRNGNAGSMCAEGFGICCEFRLVGDSKCGQSVAQNNTYIVEEGRTATGMCTYEICPCSTDICRIRFDFTQLTLANQNVGTTDAAGSTAANQNSGFNIGQCSDTFMITGVAGSSSSPTICGPNMGQHMILDNDGKSCHNININMATGTDNRQWDIRVTQYNCNNLDNLPAGPRGCLQYFTGATGNIVNYGANAIAQNTAGTATAPALTADTTHLANQNYQACVRRTGTNCRICYHPKGAAAAGVADQEGFGLSVNIGAIAKSAVEGACTTDFITIPGGVEKGQAGLANSNTKFCGRFLNTDDMEESSKTVCSRQLPFQLGVVTDNSEVLMTGGDASNDEQFGPSGGILGFRLFYTQDCA